MKKLLFSGELPPKSVHGVALSNDINIKFLGEKFHVLIDEEYVDLKYHGTLSRSKFNNYFIRLKRIVSFSVRNRFDFFYIVFSSSKVGAIKTLLIIVIFRIFNFSSRCVIHIHRGDLDAFVERSFVNRLLFYFVVKTTHRVIVLSEETKNYIERRFGKDHSVFVLPNTVNDELELDEVKNTRIQKKSNKQFVFISNYIEEKGILLLLETFKQLDDSFQLNCFGNFSDLDLKAKIMSYRSDKIKINGPIFGKSKFLLIQESDALILPSFNEGKPIVLLEALSVGTPFIAPNVGYIKEMVFEKYPFIYDKNTSKDLLDIITKFSLVTFEERINLQESLKKHYLENYSNAKHKEKLFQIFSE